VVKPETLQENLLNQIGIALLDEEGKRICETIIGNIDDNGYLQVGLDEIARKLEIAAERVEEMLALVQSLSPVGVGARNLRECLLIQLARLGKKESLAYRIVEQQLDALGARRYRQIARLMKVSPLQVQKAAELVATLDPKPGRAFSSETEQYIIPDAFVEKDGDGFKVILNDDRVPHLRISSLYRRMIGDPGAEKATKSYIRDKIKGGQWLLRNIEQRQKTIASIAEEIVRRQRDFFEEGVP
jgi:RNA polymerase sigma-54 factor